MTVMKLDHYLHLLGPDELANYLVNAFYFPRATCGIDLAVFCAALLKREIREMEIFRGGSWARSIFWSGRGLLLIGPEPGEVVLYSAESLVISVYRNSKISDDFRSLGHAPTIHPLAYNPEWTECFVFRVQGWL